MISAFINPISGKFELWPFFLSGIVVYLIVLIIYFSYKKIKKHRNSPFLLAFISILLIIFLLLIHFHPELLYQTNEEIKMNVYVEFSILLLTAFLTFLAFMAQYQFNTYQKSDLDRERNENNIFHFIDNLNGISNEFKIRDIGSHKRAFHFVFYEIKGLYYLFHTYFMEVVTSLDLPVGEHSLEETEAFNEFKKDIELRECLCDVKYLVPICISFVLSGVTSTSNAQIKKRILMLFDEKIRQQEKIICGKKEECRLIGQMKLGCSKIARYSKTIINRNEKCINKGVLEKRDVEKKKAQRLLLQLKIIKSYLAADFRHLENIVGNFQESKKDELKQLMKEERLILYIDYANIQIKQDKENFCLPWYGGHRPDLVRYMKYLNMIVQYIFKAYKNDSKARQEYYDAIFSMMSEHEVGVIYAISQSSQEFKYLLGYGNIPDTEEFYRGKDTCDFLKEVIEKWMNATNEMYKFDSLEEDFMWYKKQPMGVAVQKIIKYAAEKNLICVD